MSTDASPSPNWRADDGSGPLWRLLLDPRGRIARRTWWLYGVALPIGMGFLLHVLLGIARVRLDTAENAVNMLMLWPTVAVSAKRWHDRDQSAWWVLVVLVPVVGWLWALWCNGVLRGTAGTNRFGPDPVLINIDQ